MTTTGLLPLQVCRFHLNTEFKFGGRPQEGQPLKKPLTVGYRPSPRASTHAIELVEEDSEVCNSILAKAIDIPSAAPLMRLDSVFQASNQDSYLKYTRHSSEGSFAGFKSFDEVRRGFEFTNRQAFYPPVNVSSRMAHKNRESVFSIASVSSYRFVTNPGSTDPFDYGMPVLRERPSTVISNCSISTIRSRLSIEDHSFAGG